MCLIFRYCLKLDNRSHVGAVQFKKFYWLPIKERVYQCICISIFKFVNEMSPEYTSEVFCPSYCRHNTHTFMLMLDVPFWKYFSGQKTPSYLRPRTWNTLPAQIRLGRSINTFKHDIKKLFFDKLQKDTYDMFIYCYPTQPPIYIYSFSYFILFMVYLYTFVHRIPQGTIMKIRSTIDLYYAIPPSLSPYFFAVLFSHVRFLVGFL